MLSVRPLHRACFAPAATAFAAFLLLACLILLPASTARADVTESVLHSFSGTDGQWPSSGLSLAPNGSYYGATMYGGTIGAGCVYKISDDGLTFSVVHSFQDATVSGDGAVPVGNLLMGGDGTIYGVTLYGGAYGNGVVYSVSPSGVTTTLNSLPYFDSSGSYEMGGLTMGSTGLLYGMTPAYRNAPSFLFSLATNGSGLATRYVFDGGAAGAGPQNPVGTLTPSPNSTFYGVSASGGVGNGGTIFKLTPTTDTSGNLTFAVTVLHSFGDGSVIGDAKGMQSGVTLDAAGNLYGASDGGGQYNEGCLYELSASGAYTVTPLFGSGQGIIAQPTVGQDGSTVYGSTSDGGANYAGVVYSISPAGQYNTLYNFFQNYNSSSGSSPVTPLVQDASGNLLGTASGGASSDGVVYKMTLPKPPSLTLNPSTVAPLSYPYGPSVVTGTLSLGTPATAATTAQLQVSSNGNQQSGANVYLSQSTVTVPQGSTSATFSLSVSPGYNFTTSQIATVTASYAIGGVNQSLSANLTINPPPATLGYLSTPQSVPESTTSTAPYVSLVSAAQSDTTITLSSSDPATASVPASVVVPAGSSYASFPITTGTVAAPKDVTISASLNGGTLSQIVTVSVPGPALSSITLNPATLVQGMSSATNTVTLSGAATINSNVTLTSSIPSLVSVPASVVVPIGSTSAPFTLSVGNVASEQTVTITGRFNGGVYSANVTVEPPGLQPIILSPAITDGGTTTTANTVSIGPAVSTNTTVMLTSSDPAIAAVPASVVIPAGATSQTFTIVTHTVASNQIATITAAAFGTTRSADLVVTSVQLSGFMLANTSVTSPNTLTGNTVTIDSAVNVDTTVSLSCYPAYGPVSVPATVVIPAGSRAATFSISANLIDYLTNVTVTASLNRNSISQNLNVYPAPYAILNHVTLNPVTTIGGTTTTGNQAVLDRAATSDTTITLTSSNPSVASVPASIVTPAGTASQSFSVVTQPVTTTQTVSITAAAGGIGYFQNLTVNPLTLSGLTLAQTSVTGVATVTGNTVTIPTAVGSSTTVSLASSNPAAAGVPATAVIPAGSVSQSFTITTQAVTSATSVTITATLNGVSKTATLTVNPPATGLKSVVLSPTSVQGATAPTTANRVYWTDNAPTNETVTLTSSNTAAAAVPGTVTISSGSSSHLFTITTKAVTSTQMVTITAVCNGVAQISVLTVTPPAGSGPSLASLTLSPASTVGGTPTTNNAVSLSGNATSATTVTLASSNPAVVSVPSSILISAGSSGAGFSINTTTVTSTQTVTVMASYNGATQTATLTVTPPPAAALSSVTLSPTSTKGGTSTTANKVTLTSAATASTVVMLKSSNTAVVTVPASETIAAGSSSHGFSVTTKTVTSTQTVTITATSGGVTKTATLTVTP